MNHFSVDQVKFILENKSSLRFHNQILTIESDKRVIFFLSIVYILTNPRKILNLFHEKLYYWLYIMRGDGMVKFIVSQLVLVF